jgi:hypothetical protein
MISAYQNGHQGLWVKCLVNLEHVLTDSALDSVGQPSIPHRSFVGACQLVDESIVEEQNGRQAQVTLIKWLK